MIVLYSYNWDTRLMLGYSVCAANSPVTTSGRATKPSDCWRDNDPYQISPSATSCTHNGSVYENVFKSRTECFKSWDRTKF